MAYCKFQADQLFTGTQLLDGSHVLITDGQGIVADILPAAEAGEEVQRYTGLLMPGLINAHCHLELSHLHNRVPAGGGLVEFIGAVMQHRTEEADVVEAAMLAADAEMYRNGIVAVGDICNTASSVPVKSKSALQWHNFLEIINLDDEQAVSKFRIFEDMQSRFKAAKTGTGNAIVPHAPYSVCSATLRLLNNHSSGQTLCIHNQESQAENELFLSGTGGFIDFYKKLGRQQSPLPVTGRTSLQSWLPHFTEGQSIIMVHNTFTQEEDIDFAQQHAAKYGLTLYFCICPNANVYIENRLPNLDLLMRANFPLVIGTDSYSSNRQLNIIKEIETLLTNFPETDPTVFWGWATHHGAKALGVDQYSGDFKKGKKPGIVLYNRTSNALTRLL